MIDVTSPVKSFFLFQIEVGFSWLLMKHRRGQLCYALIVLSCLLINICHNQVAVE